MYRYFKYHAPWQILMLIIFIQSSVRMIDLPEIGINWFDKIVHFLVYGMLGFLLARSILQLKTMKIKKYYFIWSITITSFYGMTDEFHQLFTAERVCSSGDWLADTLGSILFVAIYYIYNTKKYKTGLPSSLPVKKHP